MGDGGQAGDIRVEQSREGRSLRIAQLRELVGGRRDRAVVLAHLQYRGRALLDGGGEPIGGEQLSEPACPLLGIGHVREVRTVALLELLGAPLGELIEGRRLHLVHEPHRAHGQVVVGLLEAPTAGFGQGVDTGRAASPWFRHGAERRPVPRLYVSGILKGVEVLAHAGRSDPETVGQLGSGRRTVHQEAAGDPLAPTVLEFHNSIVA
jgi:hypothetical protein